MERMLAGWREEGWGARSAALVGCLTLALLGLGANALGLVDLALVLGVVTLVSVVVLALGHRVLWLLPGLALIVLGAPVVSAWLSPCWPPPARARQDEVNLLRALQIYRERTGAYPRLEQGLGVLVEAQILGKVPVDPWDREYRYRLEGGTPVVESLGRDGTAGGEGRDADIRCRLEPRGPEPWPGCE